MSSPALGLSSRDIHARASGIGASEVAPVLGIVPGAIDVYARKVGEAPDQESSDLMEFGHRIEDVIGDAYVARHQGVRIYKPGTLRHPRHDWALATPDRVVAPPGVGRPAREAWLDLLEIKTVFFSGAEYGEAGTGQIPEKHLVQVAWQMAVADMPSATLVALVNGSYREYPVKRDPELEGLLLQAVEKFWVDHVLARVPPPIDGSDAYEAYLRRRHPADVAPPLLRTPEAEEVVARLKEAREAKVQAEKLEAEAKQQLLAIIGDAAGIQGLCTYKANRPSDRTDWEAVARELNAPLEVVARHTTTKPGARVLRLTTSKEK